MSFSLSSRGRQWIVRVIGKQTSLYNAGVVTSPNHPGIYPENLWRTQTVQVEQGMILLLQLTTFNVGLAICSDRPGCYNDELTIMDGDGTTLMEKSCGSTEYGEFAIGGRCEDTIVANITSKTNLVKFLFSTISRYSNYGWSFSWSAVIPGICTTHTHTINLFTRYVLPFSSHSWSTLRSPWRTGLLLRQRLLLLRQLCSEHHSHLCP